MITFKKIRWKNFLSTGNQFTEVDFQEKNTNLIIGTNGAGKSTILDALTFSLFNKPFRKINKPQLLNTTNEKDCVVEIEFNVNNREYLVRRGMKPNVFDIEVNGKPLHKEADDRANQKILEESIL
jgi:DNA repair exonuclease SbcCD ATPase subunit